MKTTVLMACAVLALSACSKKTETTVETPMATDTAMASETPMAGTTPMASQAATGSMVGKYEQTMADGTRATSTVNADGTFVNVSNGKETRGTWRQDGQKACFDQEGSTPEMCYTTTAPAADGSFKMMGPEGKTMATVRKIG